jgi:hypothetical protein
MGEQTVRKWLDNIYSGKIKHKGLLPVSFLDEQKKEPKE